MPNYIKLSQLMAVGVKYIDADQWATVLFNDGTVMTWKWDHWENGEGSSGDEMEFYCYKDGEEFDVVDDVGFTVQAPSWGPSKQVQRQSMWAKVFSDKELASFMAAQEKAKEKEQKKGKKK